MTDLIALKGLPVGETEKALVLDNVSSPITKRVYNMALNEFLAWFQQAPRPGFTKATVSAWRGISRRTRARLVVHHYKDVSAIRKLAAEARTCRMRGDPQPEFCWKQGV